MGIYCLIFHISFSLQPNSDLMRYCIGLYFPALFYLFPFLLNFLSVFSCCNNCANCNYVLEYKLLEHFIIDSVPMKLDICTGMFD